MSSRNLRLALVVVTLCAFGLGCARQEIERQPVPEATEGAKATLKPPEPAVAEKKVVPVAQADASAAKPFKASDEVWVLDDFERGQNLWTVEPWSDPAVLSISNGELKIELGQSKSSKWTIGRSCDLDLSDRTRFVLDVRNGAQKEVKVAVAVMGGTPPAYFESPGVAVKPGLNKGVAFDLKSDKFKSEASKWEYSTKLLGASAVKSVLIVVSGEGKGTICLDNLQGVRAKP